MKNGLHCAITGFSIPPNVKREHFRKACEFLSLHEIVDIELFILAGFNKSACFQIHLVLRHSQLVHTNSPSLLYAGCVSALRARNLRQGFHSY